MRKGELSKSAIDCGWPHQVVIPASDVEGAGYRPRYDFALCGGEALRSETVAVRGRRAVDVSFAEFADVETK